MSEGAPLYKRILLKLSGEALCREGSMGVDPKALSRIASPLRDLWQRKVQLGVVIGAGNFFRGRSAHGSETLSRVTADHIGMICTVPNALALADALRELDVPVRVFSAFPVGTFVERYSVREANKALSEGSVVLLCGGTGNPFFSTDSAACLRAVELDADVVMKATKVDGVYSADPGTNSDAEFFPKLTFQSMLELNLQVMDSNAVCIAKDNALPLRVFRMDPPERLLQAVLDPSLGTTVVANI